MIGHASASRLVGMAMRAFVKRGNGVGSKLNVRLRPKNHINHNANVSA
jgi:hypothetical protein